jgi:hypothetical protein
LCPPWSDTVLITSQNGVQTAWNNLVITEHAHKSAQIKYVVYVNDQYNGQTLTKHQQLATAHLKLDQTQHLPHKIEIVKGMKAMVLMNISTECELANGTQGVIEDIILDPREDKHSPSVTI